MAARLKITPRHYMPCRIHEFESAFAFHPNGTGNVEEHRFGEPVYAVRARVG